MKRGITPMGKLLWIMVQSVSRVKIVGVQSYAARQLLRLWRGGRGGPLMRSRASLTRGYMLFLALWARWLSCTETAEAFHTVPGYPGLGTSRWQPSGRSVWARSSMPKGTNTPRSAIKSIPTGGTHQLD